MDQFGVNRTALYMPGLDTYLHTLIIEMRPYQEYITAFGYFLLNFFYLDPAFKVVSCPKVIDYEKNLLRSIFVLSDPLPIAEIFAIRNYDGPLLIPSHRRRGNEPIFVLNTETFSGERWHSKCPFAIVSEDVEEILPDEIARHVEQRPQASRWFFW